MAHEVAVAERPETRIASVRKRIGQTEVGVWVDEAVGVIFDALLPAGLRPTGPMVARYHTWDDAMTDCEVGFPVAGTAPTGLDESTLPGGRCAVTEHIGPYDGLPAAYQAISSWVDEHDERPGGAPYEVYLADMSEGTPPAELRTLVVWPLA